MHQTTEYLPAEKPNRIFLDNLKFEEQFERERKEGFADRVRILMLESGIPPRLQKSKRDLIPKEILSLKCFNSFPERPFGLVGSSGCGKSCALSWAIRQMLTRDIEQSGPTKLEIVPVDPRKPHQYSGVKQINPEPWHQVRWIGWPAYATKMKSKASQREWTNPEASVIQLLEWISLCPDRRILILDDIGEEQIKPESYTTEQLELLIDGAYNNEARIFWTSNHTPEQMDKKEYYGPRLVSRLTGLAPDAILPESLPDLRTRDLK